MLPFLDSCELDTIFIPFFTDQRGGVGLCRDMVYSVQGDTQKYPDMNSIGVEAPCCSHSDHKLEVVSYEYQKQCILSSLVGLPSQVGAKSFLLHGQLQSLKVANQAILVTYRVACLHKHRSWTGELAYKPLARCNTGYDAARCYTLQNVLGVPGNQVTVIYDILFSLDHLHAVVSSQIHHGVVHGGVGTHVFADDSAKAPDPQDARPANLSNPKPFATEHGFPNALSLIVLDDALCRGEVCIVANGPGLLAGEANARDVT